MARFGQISTFLSRSLYPPLPSLIPWDNFVVYFHTLKLRAATYGHIWQLYCLVRGITIFISIFICSDLSSLRDLVKEAIHEMFKLILKMLFNLKLIRL